MKTNLSTILKLCLLNYLRYLLKPFWFMIETT